MSDNTATRRRPRRQEPLLGVEANNPVVIGIDHATKDRGDDTVIVSVVILPDIDPEAEAVLSAVRLSREASAAKRPLTKADLDALSAAREAWGRMLREVGHE